MASKKLNQCNAIKEGVNTWKNETKMHYLVNYKREIILLWINQIRYQIGTLLLLLVTALLILENPDLAQIFKSVNLLQS